MPLKKIIHFLFKRARFLASCFIKNIFPSLGLVLELALVLEHIPQKIGMKLNSFKFKILFRLAKLETRKEDNLNLNLKSMR